MKIGRRVFFDKFNGDIILDTGEKMGDVFPTTEEQDIVTYKVLSERNRETFDYIELEYGQYGQDFMESNGYRVNTETGILVFSYPDPSEPDVPQLYRRPLSEEIEELKVSQAETNTTLLELMEVVILS